MDVQPPPEEPPICFNEYPRIPTRTPSKILERTSEFCINGSIEKFQEVFDSRLSGPEPHEYDIRDFYKVMIQAVRLDDTQFINELFRRGLPMDQLYALEAVKAKAKRALQIFLDHGWDINQPMSELKPPVLGNAIEDEEMTAWLLDHGADPNRQCAIDLTPLSYAVESAPISIVSLLLNHGGDIQKGQLLHHAIDRQSETIELLKLLLGKGAAINATMYQNHYPSWRLYYFTGLGTVLHRASELGRMDIVRYLISQGADSRITDANGRTAIQCAEKLNQREVIQELQKEN